MSVTNNNKAQVDLPIWEWLRFAPVATAAALCTCVDPRAGGQYIYYLAGSTFFFRYHTVTDSWMQLQGPQVAPLTASAMHFSPHQGFRGRVLAATSTTLTIPGLAAELLVGKTIRITEGTGVGQSRTITSAAEPVVAETGVVTTYTSSATACSIADAQTIPKKWTINQWRGYNVRVMTLTGGQAQHRRVLFNNSNTLTFFDADHHGVDHWNNNPFSAIAPYTAPAAGSIYNIESSVVTTAAWTTTPDATSKFVIEGGGIWMATGRTLPDGGTAIQFYDVLTDTWILKTTSGASSAGIIPTLLTGEVSITDTWELGEAFDSATCDVSAARTMVDTDKAWTRDQWTGFQVLVTETSTGIVQKEDIIANSATTLYISKPWVAIPNTGYTYEIVGNRNVLWLAGNNQAAIYQYHIEHDIWAPGVIYDVGIATDISVRHGQGTSLNANTATYYAAGITAVNTTPTVAGSGYRVGDISSVTDGSAAGGQVRVVAVNASGGVTSVELYACCSTTGYSTGAGKATANVIGTGTGLTVNITAGATARVTTATNHFFKIGESVVMLGCTVNEWGSDITHPATHTIIGCNSNTVFDIVAPAGSSAVASNANGTTKLLDPTKNWTSSEHLGKIMGVMSYASTQIIPTWQLQKITTSTVNALTVATITSPVKGKGRYVIFEQKAFGADIADGATSRLPTGWANTSGSSTTVLATATADAKAWIPHQWVGYKLRVISGTGFDKGEVTITANDANTLTSAAWGFTPDDTTKYEIEEGYGIATTGGATTTLSDTTKAWPVNVWSIRPIRILAGAQSSQEVAMVTNTINQLTFGALAGNNSATTCYSILGVTVRAVGIKIMWNQGQTTGRGKYLYIPRGGASVTTGHIIIDRYDITTNRWNSVIQAAPSGELHTLGTQWAYDCGNRIYFCATGAQGSRICCLDLETRTINGAGQTPYFHGPAVQGNKMEVLTTADSLKFLYVMRQSGTEYWRELLFF